MAGMLSADVLQDEIAVSLARAMALANKRAHDLGVDTPQTLITITQQGTDDDLIWRINYGARDYIGRRGGDLIIDITSDGKTIKQVLWGQ
jgi:hypothetical protein